MSPLKLLPLLVALAHGSGPMCPFHVAEECCVTVGRSRRGISQRVLTVGVIGAGFGGLGAATRLSALGCRVQVIEARPRVGRRSRHGGPRRAWWPADAFLYTVEPDPLEWLNLERALGAPALACFTAGELALRLARLSEADLTAYLVGTLRRMFPRVENITVVATKFSNWHGDEFTRGGWSYVKPGADYPKNAEALERRILGGRGALAGEFVSAAYGTTSGAWDSGVRAAECVVGLGGCAESDSAAGVPPTDRLLVVLALAVAMLA